MDSNISNILRQQMVQQPPAVPIILQQPTVQPLASSAVVQKPVVAGTAVQPNHLTNCKNGYLSCFCRKSNQQCQGPLQSPPF